MPTIQKFEDLEIRPLAGDLPRKIYRLNFKKPFAPDFAIRVRMRDRSSSAINIIAEGFERSSRPEFINSLTVAKGEIGELASKLYRVLDYAGISSNIFAEPYRYADILTKKDDQLHKLFKPITNQG